MLIQKVLSVQGAEENSKFLRSMQNVRHIVRTQVMNDIKEEKFFITSSRWASDVTYPSLHSSTNRL